MPHDMSETNVLFIWKVRDELQEYLRNGLPTVKKLNLIFLDDVSEETLRKSAPDADILVGWRPSRELLDTATKFRLFFRKV